MEYQSGTQTTECWVMRISVIRHLIGMHDTLIDDHGTMLWIDHYRLTDVRGQDWSRMEHIMNRVYWTMGVMAMLSALVFEGWLQSLT